MEMLMDCLIFQSTLPTRGSDTDDLWGIERYVVAISIHAPHEGERLIRIIEPTG